MLQTVIDLIKLFLDFIKEFFKMFTFVFDEMVEVGEVVIYYYGVTKDLILRVFPPAFSIIVVSILCCAVLLRTIGRSR